MEIQIYLKGTLSGSFETDYPGLYKKGNFVKLKINNPEGKFLPKVKTVEGEIQKIEVHRTDTSVQKESVIIYLE